MEKKGSIRTHKDLEIWKLGIDLVDKLRPKILNFIKYMKSP